MWVNMSMGKMSAAFEKEGFPVLYSKKNMQVMTSAKGFVAGYALFKQGDHTMGCSFSVWESREDAEAWFGSKEYIAMVGEIIQYVVERPDRQGWDVAADLLQVAKG
jgi:heme-degrading monooxygenase HmoA